MNLEWKRANIQEPITYRAPLRDKLSEQQWTEVAEEMWLFFSREIVPLNQTEEWEVVRGEFWLDSGRFLLIVAQEEMSERIDKGSCELASTDLMDAWNECATKHAENDEQFIKALLKRQRAYARLFTLALARLIARGACANLKGRNVQFWNSDGEEVITEEF